MINPNYYAYSDMLHCGGCIYNRAVDMQNRLFFLIRKLFLFFLLAFLLCFSGKTDAQTYEALNYYYNGTPSYGVKIKTNIPFQDQYAMPALHIEGYNYAGGEPIGLSLVWYVYNHTFKYYGISSWGAYTPPVYLSNENGMITIFIDDRRYFQRFKITVYNNGIVLSDSTWFRNWTTADEPLGGTDQKLVPYINDFAGTVSLHGKLIVNDGNVLIGKTSQSNGSYRLDVNGNVRANKVVVNTSGADFVFDSTYQLYPLQDVECYLKRQHHLPGVPTAKEMQSKGMDVGILQTVLLKKIEELTLYLIKEHKTNQDLQQRISVLEHALNKSGKKHHK